MRRISIFGATGSIGQNTVDLIDRQGGREAYQTVALTGGRNAERLAADAHRLGAEIAVVADEAAYPALKAALAGTGVEAAAGRQALLEAAARPADWTMSAIVGAAGLEPTLMAARNSATLALANKESLVCAGALVQETCARHNTRLLPVDSEHSAIFQALNGEDRGAVARILLTASGGPFRDWPLEKMARATPAEAKAHPNWSMGERISIDSASMFNKALELIETHVLFGIAPDAIEVLVHPQSIVHSAVAFQDGSVIAQMGVPDMRGAIGYALNWPERRALPVEPLDLARLSRLDFRAEDPARFPALALARRVLAMGGLAGAVFNAAKEAALDLFLAEKIGFLDMAGVVAHVIDAVPAPMVEGAHDAVLEAVLALDAEARSAALEAAALGAGAPQPVA